MGWGRRKQPTREPGDLPEREVTTLSIREGPSIAGQLAHQRESSTSSGELLEVFFVIVGGPFLTVDSTIFEMWLGAPGT